MITKVCLGCKLDLPVTKFHKRGFNKTGEAIYKPRCVDCRRELEADYRKSYREKNKDNIRSYNNSYEKNRKETDSIFRLKRNIRSLICKSFSVREFKKQSKTEDILGCSVVEFHNHIENQFLPGMNWSNRHLWHIDHIKPLSTATTYEEVLELNNYKNLRPLWADENLKKREYDRRIWN